MIYFVVNNNYHVVDFESHLASLRKHEVSLIEIPHTLEMNGVEGIRRFTYVRSSKHGLLAQIMNFLLNVFRINQEISPKSGDFLFIYTEYEILNQYLAGYFKKAGARVYLIEDGGLGTYVPFRLIESEPLNLKEWIKEKIYRILPGLSKIRLHKLNGHVFQWMSDATIDAVCIYKPVSLKRLIKTIILKRNYEPSLTLIPGRTIFLNEPIYGIYQGSEEYLSGLEQIIEALCGAFDEVFFKFHPRETTEWRIKIQNNVLSRYPKVTLLQETSPVETLVEKYRPAVASSYFCSALLSLAERGIEPLYMYHLLPNLENQIVSREVTAVLMELDYHFVQSFSEITPNYNAGFRSRSHVTSAISLVDLVNRR